MFRITIDNKDGNICRVSEALDLVSAFWLLNKLRDEGGWSARLRVDSRELRQMFVIRGVGFELEEPSYQGK